jgi:hypothetical protein
MYIWLTINAHSFYQRAHHLSWLIRKLEKSSVLGNTFRVLNFRFNISYTWSELPHNLEKYKWLINE